MFRNIWSVIYITVFTNIHISSRSLCYISTYKKLSRHRLNKTTCCRCKCPCYSKIIRAGDGLAQRFVHPNKIFLAKYIWQNCVLYFHCKICINRWRLWKLLRLLNIDARPHHKEHYIAYDYDSLIHKTMLILFRIINIIYVLIEGNQSGNVSWLYWYSQLDLISSFC